MKALRAGGPQADWLIWAVRIGLAAGVLVVIAIVTGWLIRRRHRSAGHIA